MPNFYPKQEVYSPWTDIGNSVTNIGTAFQNYTNTQNQMRDLVQRRIDAAQNKKDKEELDKLELARQLEADTRAKTVFDQGQEQTKYLKAKQELDDKNAADMREYALGEKVLTNPETTVPIAGPLENSQTPSMLNDFKDYGQYKTTPAEYSRTPRTRQEIADYGLSKGSITLDKYLDDTKPATGMSLADREYMARLNAGLKPDPIAPREPTKLDVSSGRRKLVNLVTGEETDLGPVAKKPISQKVDLTIRTKLNQIKNASDQLNVIQAAFDAAKKEGKTGLIEGRIPFSDAGGKFESAVDIFKNTLTSMTRVPGVGAQSDFDAKIALAPLPKRGEKDAVTQDRIDQIRKLIDNADNGYAQMASESEVSSDSPPPNASRKPKAGLTPAQKTIFLYMLKNPNDPRAAETFQKFGE